MKGISRRVQVAILASGLIAAASAVAQEVKFSDPTGDDNGPGTYVYPTDPLFAPGSFDLTDFRLKAHGDKVDVEVNLAAKLTDPWSTGSGFSLQMIFIFIQTESRAVKPAAAAGTAASTATGAAPSTGAATTAGAAPAGVKSAAKAPPAKPVPKPTPGITQGLPGLNVQFAPEQAWDRCVILAPDPERLRQEIDAKVPAALRSALVPARAKGSGHTISASFPRQALGPGDPKNWGFQVVVASYDPYPSRDSLLVRRVDKTESQFRFGGGTDTDCDPNVLDLLAGTAAGQDGEAELQHQMLQFDCKPGAPRQLASLEMMRIKKELTREEKRAKKKEDEAKAKEEVKPPGAQPPP
jgi:carbohydrate-binding DOMON domain-containing protein